MELEPPKTPETSTPTAILLSSSPDIASEAESETIHVQVGPKPPAIFQNTVPQKRAGRNKMITPERVRLDKPVPSANFQFQKRKGATTLPVVHTVQDAIYIARDMVLQASTLADPNKNKQNC
jgi:hypothetical protein